MPSQRGILNQAHAPAQLEMAARLTNAVQLNGVDTELWGPNEIRERRLIDEAAGSGIAH